MILRSIKWLAPITGIALILGTSCSKSDFDINKNPNQPTDSTVSYDVILPSALDNTGRIIANQWGFLQNWMGYWARSGTYAPSVTEESYTITTTFGNGVWNSCYDNLYDYQTMINKATRAQANFYAGIGRIMKAHDYQILVDVYGNVPYSQALSGNANTTPKYDKGIDIYKDLFRQIDTGISLIASATTSLNKNIATDDIMFKGDKTQWYKFGNTLKLRMLVHAYRVSGFDIAGEVTKITAQGSGFLGVDQNAQVNPGYTNDDAKRNPFYSTYISATGTTQVANNVYYRANEWGIGYYAGDADPRQTRFYVAGSGGLKGVKYGLPPVTANASAVLAGIGPGVAKTSTASQQILTSAESFFLQAEARIRGMISTGATADALLNSGMLESFKYLGVTDPPTALAAYKTANAGYADVDITAPALATGFPTGGIFTVLSQKWFALNATNTLEVWSDYRRVDYNTLATKAGAATDHFVYGEGAGYTPGPPLSVAPQNVSTKIPVRLLYPQTEYNYNGTNVSAEGAVDRFTSRIFWDIN